MWNFVNCSCRFYSARLELVYDRDAHPHSAVRPSPNGWAYGRQAKHGQENKYEQVPNLSTGRAVFLVGGKGLEPLASCMSSMRSNQLS